MITNTRIIRTNSTNPWRNLAVEEYLLDGVQKGQCILYLWQNRDTVVIGRNQNPWRECRTEQLEKDGGRLARRLSGGGAVYHDLGNLNFTFLTDRENYDVERQMRVILEAVQSFGINAIISGRNDLTVEGRKFSGNAFCFKRTGALHHGTILVDSDFSRLSGYLNVPEEKMRTKGIQSVRSRVVNLTEFVPTLSIDYVAEALIKAFRRNYGGDRDKGDRNIAMDTDGSVDADIDADIDAEIDADIDAGIKELEQKYSSWEWRYGNAPQFGMDLDTRFTWGGIEIGLKLENGKISEASVYSDAMDEEYISMLPSLLRGCAFKSFELAERIRAGANSEEGAAITVGIQTAGRIETAGDLRKQMAGDIALWLESKGF